MILGIDFSPTYIGLEPSSAFFSELGNRFGMRRAIIACGDTAAYNAWAEAATTAGWGVEAYLELPNTADWGSRINALGAAFTFTPDRLWLALEDTSLPLPTQAGITELLNRANALNLPLAAGIYSGAWYWSYLSGVDVSALAPLWTANYTTHPPETDTGFDVSYGGWVRASCVQYAGDVTLLGADVDLDAWPDSPL